MSNFGLMANESGEMLALRGIDVDARIAGVLAETALTQKYRNDSSENLELAYTFPLPLGGTLLTFQVRIGERQYAGEVIPRKEAEVAYEEAISEGNSAFRLQEIRPGMYNATLGNVMAGEAVEITLRYAEVLAWNGKSLRYRLPTTIAPRYGEPTGMQPWQRPVTSIVPEYPLNLSITLMGALAQSSIVCPSHKVAFKPGPDILLVTLGSGATMDRDFILEIQNDAVQSLGVTAAACDTNIAVLTLLPPEVEHPENDRDTVIVIDCSGSMQGDSLVLAKEGVQLSLGSLTPDERFGIVAFGTRFLQFDKELQPANRKNLDMARRWVNHLDNLGGTNLLGALEMALALHGGQPMDILLLTDGEAWNLGDAISQAKDKGVRIFTIGVGSAVAEDTVRSLAEETGGACELVSPTEEMSERIFRHFQRMRQPKMTQLNIRWPTAPLWESRPEVACFAGDAYTVAAAFADTPASPVSVSFEFEGRAPVTLEVPMPTAEGISDAIVRLAARKRLASLPQGERQEWAVRFQLITDQTDYLIKVERAAEEKAESLPNLQVVPQMLPAGWGGTSSVVSASMPASEIRFSLASASVDYNQIADVPAVVRKRNVTVEALANTGDSEYNNFIKKLNARAGRKLFGGLPTDLAGLLGMSLPSDLKNLLDEFVRENFIEDEIVVAFYQAILEHDGRDSLSDKCRQKLATVIGERVPDATLVTRCLEELNRLFRMRGAGGVSRYDIPAFLRKQVD